MHRTKPYNLPSLPPSFPRVIVRDREAGLFFNKLQPIGVGAGALGILVVGAYGPLLLGLEEALVLTRRNRRAHPRGCGRSLVFVLGRESGDGDGANVD